MAKRRRNNKAESAVPLSGSTAHFMNFTAADCPFPEGSEDFIRWNNEYDEAADLAEEGEAAAETHDPAVEELGEEEPAEEDGEPEVEVAEKSVVKEEFRARYAEAGHPAHCGDELAVLLNNLCLTKAGIDMPRFEAICANNEVDLSKYNRTTKGWQGRLRMTGRNILAGKVYSQGGILKAGIEGTEPEYKMSAEWMAGRRRKKGAAETTGAAEAA